MSVRYGEVFYIHRSGKEAGSEMQAGRPGVVVSNDSNNEYSKTITVVYLSSKRATLPTHIPLPARDGLRRSIAMCETVTTVSRSRLGNFITALTDEEMALIRKGCGIQLNMGSNL